MHIATLITSPAAPCLDRATVEALRDAWGGGAAHWLAEGEAAEFALDAPPGNLWEVWEALQARGVDLCVQQAKGRRRRLLIADMDSTMIGQECIDELAAVAGVGPQVAAITARAMAGELEFEDALRARVALLAGRPAALVAEVLRDRIALAPGAAALVATMRAAGAQTMLVSGGFLAFAEPVGARLGFDAVQANGLEVAAGRLTGRVTEPILGREAKAVALRAALGRLGLAPADAMSVGDGANDLAMLGLAGAGVAMHAKPAVAAKCALRIAHGDLTACLYLQGYTRTEFAA